MKKYTVYGSCQAHGLATMLNTNPHFTLQYQYYQVKPTWGLTLEEITHYNNEIFPQMDLFIYQPVANYDLPMTTKYITENVLKKDCVVIVFPFLYFNAYHPYTCYIHNPSTDTGLGFHLKDWLYHDRNLINAYCQPNFDLQTLLNHINNPDFYVRDYLVNQLETSLYELRRQENAQYYGHQIKIADFISNQYQIKLLFWTVNHPTKYVFQYLAFEICNVLNIWTHYDENLDPLLHFGITPLYHSVAKHLNLQFDYPKLYEQNNQKWFKKQAFILAIQRYNEFCQTPAHKNVLMSISLR